jgi:LPS-assembly protein
MRRAGRAGISLRALVAAAGLAGALALGHGAALAQDFTDRFADEPEGRLVYDAANASYDREADAITLSGDVKLYYNGRTLEADRVVYNRRTKRVFAVGDARLVDRDGTRYFGERFELTDDFRDGFIDQFRAITIDRQRYAAPRVERVDGETTVLEKGVYTPCEPCKRDPTKAPLWQVKAGRIIHKASEKMVYYENAVLEVGGVPVLWTPFFSAPDPSVTRKTGFLAPVFFNSNPLGFGAGVPFFWAIAPNMDLTLTPILLSRQGFLGKIDWRHRLSNGAYDIRLAGIFQQDPGAFLPSPNGAGDLDFRGSILSTGEFALNRKWRFGWDVKLSTDRFFYSNYEVDPGALGTQSLFRDATSQVYLIGQGERSYFDARGYYFQSTTVGEDQEILPVVHPSLEYDRRFTVLGGELDLRINTLHLSREQSDIERLAYSLADAPEGSCAVVRNGRCVLLRGLAGQYNRLVGQLSWRRSFIDDIGQVWTPFAAARLTGVGYSLSNRATSAERTLFNGTEETSVSAMPTIGLDYRYPFYAASSIGTHIVEPVAQIVASPDEARAGDLPNEDSQTVTFDDTNLFDWNKFSGYGRIEGGVRANLGLNYTLSLASGGYVNAVAGQSFHLAGKNSFAAGDPVNAGLQSGLDSPRSDYVARVTLAPQPGWSLSARGRFDEQSLALNRLEVFADARLGPVTTSITYARYDEQPELGFNDRREGLLTSARVSLTENWTVNGGVLFDLDAREKDLRSDPTSSPDRFQIVGANLGLTYADQCTVFSANWAQSVTRPVTGKEKTTQTFMVRLELRNLGEAGYSYSDIDSTGSGVAPTR